MLHRIPYIHTCAYCICVHTYTCTHTHTHTLKWAMLQTLFYYDCRCRVEPKNLILGMRTLSCSDMTWETGTCGPFFLLCLKFLCKC